jgi:CheY-like chemotaxis protein
LQQLADAGAAAIVKLSPGDRARRRILVVDSDEDVAESVGDLLRMLGHDVATAHDSLRALDVVELFRPEIAILDIGLPLLDGYELARLLALADGAPFLIAISGYSRAQDRARAQAAGFGAYLVKPFTAETLADLIADVT